MTGKTTIEWTHQPGYEGDVWNPTTGCTRVSAGCDNCYAFALHDKRYKANLDASREEKSDGFWTEPDLPATPANARTISEISLPFPRQYDLPFSRVQLLPDRLDDPLRHRKPERYFVDSMSDLFHPDVPDYFIAEVFATMAGALRHQFLILTKRPERMAALLRTNAFWVEVKYRTSRNTVIDTKAELDIVPDPIVWTKPLPNVWLGTSVEDQASADERIPHLLATPAAVRFLSCEPLLGPVAIPDRPGAPFGETDEDAHERCSGLNCGIDWVIVGGESGPRARPMDLAWARSLVAQCRAAGVAPFVKQLGSKPDYVDDGGAVFPLDLRESHGRDMSEWPEDLRVREWPTT